MFKAPETTESRGYIQRRPFALCITDSGISLTEAKASRYSGSMGRKRHRGRLIRLFAFSFEDSMSCPNVIQHLQSEQEALFIRYKMYIPTGS